MNVGSTSLPAKHKVQGYLLMSSTVRTRRIRKGYSIPTKGYEEMLLTYGSGSGLMG